MFIALMALALLAGETAAEPAKPDYILKPVWRNRPTAGDLRNFYPARAGNVPGRAVVECVANASGALEQCHSIEENPVGIDFDKAAVALVVSKVSIGSKDLDGRAVAGRPIRIPISWSVLVIATGADVKPGVTTVILAKPEGARCDAALNCSATGPVRGSDPSLEGEMLASTPKPSLEVESYGWAAWPKSRDIARARPKYLLRSAEPGGAVLFCRLKADGRLTACEVVAEAPTGRGFGAAALKLVPLYRMNLPQDGSSLEGETVRIPLTWSARKFPAARGIRYTPPSITIPPGMRR